MKSFMLFIVVLAVSVTGCSKSNNNKEANTNDPNEILIEVNGKTLIRSEAMRQVDVRLGGPPPADLTVERINIIRTRVLSQVVDQFVKRTLLLEEADRLNISATDKEIEKGLSLIKAHTPKGEKPSGIMKDGPAGDDSIRNEVITGIRIDKLIVKTIPVKNPTEAEVDTFISENKAKLTHPEKGPMPRNEIIKLMKNRSRQKALFDYIRELQQKADIKHAPSLRPPIYPEEK